MSENNRKFTIPDPTLLEHASRVKTTLSDDLDDFHAFDRTIDKETVKDLDSAIEKVNNIKTDDVVIDEMTELTDMVNLAMGNCNSAFKTVAFFARKVFKDNKAVQNQLGLNDIAKARNKHAQMIVFMNSLAKVAAKYKDELVKGGMNGSVVDSLPGLHQELLNANNNQEVFKKERGIITQERVNSLNKLYDLLLPISDIARIIYADNPAQLAKYTMPSPPSSTQSEDDLVV